MSQLWDIVQAHLDKYGVRSAALARLMDTSPQTLDSWKNRGLRKLPDKHLLLALARETQTPYRDVLDAVLHDIGYLPEKVMEHARSASSARAGRAGARKGVRARTNRQGPHLREVDASSKVKDTSGQGNESP